MASEAEASCESYPNFAIICAFIEKFGELCGIGSIDFVELQNMLENNQEVSPELMNLHIKLLRKTKKNVTVERWERALVNMCHNYSSKDAWEIERFGYKKTRLQVKLRALKELLEMQFDYNTKFKNEVNKMSSDSLRAQPLGRDKLGRAYWFQTDNNYQIRIYKEDPDEETWHLIAKDREGLLSLINELADGDSKLSSDSALNEDSNSLSEKPFIDTGQSDNSNESKPKDNTDNPENKILRNPELIVSVQKLDVGKKNQPDECKSDNAGKIAKGEERHVEIKVSKLENEPSEVAEKKNEPEADIKEDKEDSSEVDDEEEEDLDESEESQAEVKRPMLRIKSLSELMEKPKETRKSNFLPGLPELSIIKKAKLDSSQITITRRPKVPPKEVQVSPAVESPLMIIKGSGSGSSNQSSNIIVGEEINEPVMYISGEGSGNDCQAGKSVEENCVVSEEIEEPVMYFFGDGSGQCCLAGNNSPRQNEDQVIVSEEIEEEVFYIFGDGSGEDCQTGNEKEQSTTQQLDQSKSTEANSLQDSKLGTSEPPIKVPIDSVNLDTKIDSKTDKNINSIDKSSDKKGNEKEEFASPKKMQFFFGPGSLNIKPSPSTGSSETLIPEEVGKNNGSVLGEIQGENSEDKDASDDSTQPKGDEALPAECSESKAGENQDNQANETSKNESENNQFEEEEFPVSKQDQGKNKESTNSDEKETKDDELKSGKIEEKPTCDNPVEEENKIAETNDLTSKKGDSKNECSEEENNSVNIVENIEEKVNTTGGGNIQGTDQKEEDKSDMKELEENIPKDLENLKATKEEKDEAIEESEILCDAAEVHESTKIKETTENQELAKIITADETPNNINKIEDNSTVPTEKDKVEREEDVIQNVEDKSEESKIEGENDTTLEEAEVIEKGKCEEKQDTTSREADNTEGSKLDQKNDAITEKADKSEEVEENKDTTSKVGDLKKNTEVKKKKDKSSKDDEIEESKQEGKKETIPKEDATASSGVDNIKTIKDKEEISQKKIPVKNNDNEDDEDETINQDKKRKRVTRNTPSLNESIGEEDMHPRKKVPVEKIKKKGPQKATKVNDEKVEDEGKDEIEEVAETRNTRQTRQTRAATTVTKVQSPPPPKNKGKLKKTASQTSKSDEAESPAPLESVIIDTDNSNTAAENPETDPLAVSEEEVGTVNQTVSSITSFSFDYNPNSPAPEESKRGLRKRGRDNSDDKPEPLEKVVKRPKMKGKRAVDQTLRKSVEERRQQVGDGSSDENELPKKEIKAKGGKKVPVKKKVDTSSVSESDNASTKAVVKGKKEAAKNARLLKNLGVKEEDISSIADSSAPVRQSRRLAQIKIKEEATKRRDDDDVSIKKKKKKSDDKDFKVGKRKRIEEEVKPAPTPPMVEKKRKKKTKPKKISIGWRSSSEDSDNSGPEEEEVSEYEEHHEEEPLQFKSDHEFSPESDLEEDEPLPLKRARTVRKEESDDGEPEEEFPCQKCGKSDHPEWILLCDKCDNGWHCSCLRPPLFVIPEGDWFCPSCQHETLLENLNLRLVEYDKMMLKKEMEDRRKERLAYVGISLNNVLPAKHKKEKKSSDQSDSERSSRENTPSGSDSEESDSDEPIYQLRQRRQAHSYKFQDYDDLINSALEEEPPPEVEKTHTLGRGKDIATIVNAAKEEEEKNGFEDLPPVVPRDPEENRKKAMSYRKKPKRLNNLEVNSDDEADDSDEDFKGSSSDESEEEEYSENSDDSFVGRKSSRPVRRSTRARTTRFDADFINDEDSDNGSSRKKKKKRYFSDSESSVSDDWRGKKKSKKSHKKSKKKKGFDDSDLENYRKKKPKIKYGMDSEDDTKARRTRGKKTSYLDTLGSDSEDETLKKKLKNKSDDEYVAEDDEEKESEEEEEPEVEKPSGEEDEDEDEVNGKKHDSEESDSEDETLVVKKMKLKNKRAIMDSDEEEEEEEETEEKEKIKGVEKKVKPPKPIIKSAIDKELEEAAEEFRKGEEKTLEEPKTLPIPPILPPKDKQEPPVPPGLNVDKLKACGITVTKVAKDKIGIPPSVADKESPIKLIEIGVKPLTPVLNQRNNPVTLAPVTLKKLEKNLDELDEDEVEEMMENEEYANRQLELAAIQIRQAKRMKEQEEKAAAPPPPAILRKPVDIIPKKPMGGRFFNMKPPQESMLGNPSLVMNDDDNDELSEPPGVTLPLFSELGSMKVHNLSKSNNTTRSPSNNTPPPPLSPSRAVPVPLHNMPMGAPHPLSGNIPMVPPNPFVPSRPPGMMHPMRPTRPMGLRGSNMAPMMTPRGPMPPMDPNHPMMVPPMGMNVPGSIPNPPRNMNMPPMSSSASLMGNNIPMGSSAPLPMSSNTATGSNLRMGLMSPMVTPSGLNMTMGSNMPLGPMGPGNGAPGQNSVGVLGTPGPNLPSSINESPEGTPKKRKGRGKGKKTLAAEAAAAAAAAGLPPSSETNKTTNPKPPVANIEIASPPQPFSQSQPAPSVITRMLQTTPGKGAFPVGRIRPKQFAMMQESDDNDSPRPVEPQEKDMSTLPPPVTHAPVTGSHGGHTPGHYGPPPGQYPPNYYPKDGQPQPSHGFHQRPAPPPMHPYPPHPSQAPMDPPPMNPPPINQPPINMADPPAMGQYPSAPPPSKSPYEGMPPHRPPYPNSNPVYNYDYNVPPPVMGGDEGVAPPSYENSSTYPDQYEAGSSNMDPGTKNVEEENSGEFGGLVSYFSSQHEDELEQ